MKKPERKKAQGKAIATPVQDRALREPREQMADGRSELGRPDPAKRRPGSLSRSILGALVLFSAFSLQPSAFATVTVTGMVYQVTSAALDTKVTFTPSEDVYLVATGLSAGPAKTISSTNGAFGSPLDPGRYLVRLPLVGGRNAFTIDVPVGTGSVNITSIISAPWTYAQFVATMSGDPNAVTNTQTGVTLQSGTFGGTFTGPGYNMLDTPTGLLKFNTATNYGNGFGVTASGDVYAASLNGPLAASQLTGTIDDARLPATITSDITGNAATATAVASVAGNAAQIAAMIPTNLTANAAQLGAMANTNDANYQMSPLIPWVENAMRAGQPFSVGFIGDSIMQDYGPMVYASGLVQAMQQRYGTNGGFSVFADNSLYGAWGTGGSYRTNTSGTDTGTSSPWAYGVIPAGGSAFFQLNATTAFLSANRIHVGWRVLSGAGTLSIKTRGSPSFSPTTTWASVNAATGTSGTSAYTNVNITTGVYQLQLDATTAAVEIISVAFYNTNKPGVLFGQLAQSGKTDWSISPKTNWQTAFNGFHPSMVIASEKNDLAHFPTFLNMLTDVRNVWTNTSFILLGSQPDVLDGTGVDRQLLNRMGRAWCATNNAIYYECTTGDTNLQFALGFQTTAITPHNTPAGTAYIYSHLFRDLGLLRGIGDWNTNATDYVAGNRWTAGTNYAAYHAGNGSGLSNAASALVTTFTREKFVNPLEWAPISNVTLQMGGVPSPASVVFNQYFQTTDNASHAIIRRSVPYGYGYSSAVYTIYVQATNVAQAYYPFYTETISWDLATSAKTYTLSSVQLRPLTNGINPVLITNTWPNDTALRESGLIFADNTNNSSLFIGGIKESWQ